MKIDTKDTKNTKNTTEYIKCAICYKNIDIRLEESLCNKCIKRCEKEKVSWNE
jgi:hypothetical protein